MISKKHEKVCVILKYIDHLLTLVSTVNGCILVTCFASLVDIFVAVASSMVGIKICAMFQWIKKYKAVIKKNKHDKMVLSAKSKIKNIKFWISKALFNSNISHDEFIFINNVLKEYDDIKEEIKNLKT